MDGIWRDVRHTARMLARFIGLTFLASLALAISILINLMTIACMQLQLWLLLPGFPLLASGHSLLASVTHFLGLAAPSLVSK